MLVRLLSRAVRHRSSVLVQLHLVHTLQAQRAYHAECEPWQSKGQPIEQAATPPSSWYTSGAVVSLERARVFQRNWQVAACAGDLAEPGSFVTGSVAGMPYVICKDESNQLQAFHNVCRHHAAAVASGSGTASCFTCPYHGWQYSLQGRLVRATKLKGISNFRAADNGLVPLSVAEWGAFVFVAHCPKQPSLKGWLGRGGQAMLPRIAAALHRPVHTHTYHIQCNWKVFIDNYLDGGYHVPLAHPGLAAGIDMKSYTSSLYETMSIQTVQPAPDQSRRLGDAQGQAAAYAFLFPNFMMNAYGPWLDTHQVVPCSATQCSVHFTWYLHPDLAGDQQYVKSSLDASHQVQLEDIALCEAVQRGLGSPAYDTGRYSSVETPMKHFHELLAQQLSVVA